MNRIIEFFKKFNLEAVLWIAALTYLLFINPYEPQHFTLCPFHNIGVEFCPGCGLGRSISFFYHGDFIHSLKTHPLGIVAFLLISFRIAKLTKRTINNFLKTKEVLNDKRI